MNQHEIIHYLDGQLLVNALWWFIENQPEDAAVRTEVFFYLRERVRDDR